VNFWRLLGFATFTSRRWSKPPASRRQRGWSRPQLAATPLSTLGVLTEETQQTIAREMRAALRPYLSIDSLAVPMEAHVALAHA
jgi:hypothetical protein